MVTIGYQDSGDMQLKISVFVSDYDLKIPYAAKEYISLAKIAEELNQIIGLVCTGYHRAELSTEQHAYLTRGYIFTCCNQANYRHSSSEMRSVVRSIIETLKEPQ